MGKLALSALCLLSLCACSNSDNTHSNESVHKTTIEDKAEKTQQDIDQEAKKYREKIEDQHQALENQDRPQFEWPHVDYTQAVAKVDLNDDQAILKAVRKPVIEKEEIANENGERATIYYFSENLVSGLELTLSREFIDVIWKFDAKNSAQATHIFEDGQRITRALFGGKLGGEIYEKITKGLKFDKITLEDGTIVKNLRCSTSACRYKILR